MSGVPASALVGVIGAGAMGSGIAQVAAAAGHPILLLDSAEGAANKGRAAILAALARQVDKGRISEERCKAIGERIRIAHEIGELKEAALVIEAIAEDLEAKRTLLRKLQ